MVTLKFCSQTQKSCNNIKNLCSIRNSITVKYCSIAFICIVTVKDFMCGIMIMIKMGTLHDLRAVSACRKVNGGFFANKIFVE